MTYMLHYCVFPAYLTLNLLYTCLEGQDCVKNRGLNYNLGNRGLEPYSAWPTGGPQAVHCLLA